MAGRMQYAQMYYPIAQELYRGYKGLQRYWNAPARIQRKRKRRRYSGRYRGGVYNPGTELKFHDIAVNDAVIAAGGTIVVSSCNLIAQGDGESQRIGRKVTIKSINWRYSIQIETATSNVGDDIIRLVLYQDKQANGATSAVLGVYEDNDYQTFRNLTNKGRFRILMDRTYALNTVAGSGNGTNSRQFSAGIQGTFFKKCNIPVEFSAGAGALTEITSNNIGVIAFSRTGRCELQSAMRIRFTG